MIPSLYDFFDDEVHAAAALLLIRQKQEEDGFCPSRTATLALTEEFKIHSPAGTLSAYAQVFLRWMRLGYLERKRALNNAGFLHVTDAGEAFITAQKARQGAVRQHELEPA